MCKNSSYLNWFWFFSIFKALFWNKTKNAWDSKVNIVWRNGYFGCDSLFTLEKEGIDADASTLKSKSSSWKPGLYVHNTSRWIKTSSLLTLSEIEEENYIDYPHKKYKDRERERTREKEEIGKSSFRENDLELELNSEEEAERQNINFL